MLARKYRNKFLVPIAAAILAAAATAVIAEVAHHRSQERVRIVRGSFDLNGNVLAGAGFTVDVQPYVRDDGGPALQNFKIRFDRPFRSLPTLLGAYEATRDSPGSIDPTRSAIAFVSIDALEVTTETFRASDPSFFSFRLSFIAVAP